MTRLVDKIVSGGQTGADRGGLDAALRLGIPHGGWCPKGRRSEDGGIPPRYRLLETDSTSYQVRTRRNVLDSDGTVIFHRLPLTGGTRLTAQAAQKLGKPCLLLEVDLVLSDRGVAAQRFCDWIENQQIRILNVAGPRGSKFPNLQQIVADFLVDALGLPEVHRASDLRTVDSNLPMVADGAAIYGEPSDD